MSAFVGAFAARRALEDDAEPDLAARNAALVAAIVLVAFSGLFSGLNLGLMSFSAEDLKIIIKGSGDPDERVGAEKLPLRDRGNLCCARCCSATRSSTPSSRSCSPTSSARRRAGHHRAHRLRRDHSAPVCSRHGLQIGAMAVPIVWAFVYACWVVAYPISILLDSLLGREVTAVAAGTSCSRWSRSTSRARRTRRSWAAEQDAGSCRREAAIQDSLRLHEAGEGLHARARCRLDWRCSRRSSSTAGTHPGVDGQPREHRRCSMEGLLGLGFERAALSTVVDKTPSGRGSSRLRRRPPGHDVGAARSGSTSS